MPSNQVWDLETLFTSNLVGMMFARSMHYQYINWYFAQIPFLLWRIEGLHFFGKIAIYLACEKAWNQSPPTPISSIVLNITNLTMLVCVFLSNRKDKAEYEEEKLKNE